MSANTNISAPALGVLGMKQIGYVNCYGPDFYGGIFRRLEDCDTFLDATDSRGWVQVAPIYIPIPLSQLASCSQWSRISEILQSTFAAYPDPAGEVAKLVPVLSCEQFIQLARFRGIREDHALWPEFLDLVVASLHRN